MDLSAQTPTSTDTCTEFTFLPGSGSHSGEGFNSFLTLELPLAPRKDLSDHPAKTPCHSPNSIKRCTGSLPSQGSPRFPRDPICGLSEICLNSPPSLSSPDPPSSSPLPQLPHLGSCSPLFRRPFNRDPMILSAPPSPCCERVSFVGRATDRSASACSWISSPRTPCFLTSNPGVDQPPYLYCCSPSQVTSPGSSPTLIHRSSLQQASKTLLADHMFSSQFAHQPPNTNPMNSSSIPPGSLGSCPISSPPGTGLVSPLLPHRSIETRPVTSPSLSHRILEPGPKNPPLFSASSPPTSTFYPGQLKTLDCSSCPQEGSYHCSLLTPECTVETHTSVSESPCCTMFLPRPPESQDPRKSVFESLFSWETGGSSYIFVNPADSISCPPCATEPSLTLCSPCSYPAFFPSPLCTQLISPPHSPPCRSYNDPPHPISVCTQVKAPKSEVKPRAPHKCRSLVTTVIHTSDQPKPPATSAPAPPPSNPSGPCTVTSVTTCSNPCPKEGVQGPSPLPPVASRTLKTVIPTPTSLPVCIPCESVIPISYTPCSPQGTTGEGACSTYIYSMVSPTTCPLSYSLDQSLCSAPICSTPVCPTPVCPTPVCPTPICPTPVCPTPICPTPVCPTPVCPTPVCPAPVCSAPVCPTPCQPIVPPCGICYTPSGPPQSQTMASPCSAHIYSFIPLGTPFDYSQCLPISPQTQIQPDSMPCGLHVYSVTPYGSPKESPQDSSNCPLSSPLRESCSTTVVVSDCHETECQGNNQDKALNQGEGLNHLSRSQSQKDLHLSINLSRNKSSPPVRSRSSSSNSQESLNQDQSETLKLSGKRGECENLQHGKAKGSHQSQNRSPRSNKNHVKSKSPAHSKSPQRTKVNGQSKSPHKNKT